MNNPFTIKCLDICYENGEGVSQDINKAIECYQKAADL
jgi:TPR repeat protein